jgi:hypothetical protein
MLETIVGALLPAVMTVLLGYVAAHHHDFDAKDVPVLTRMMEVSKMGMEQCLDKMAAIFAKARRRK